jgi:hypothetical protein
MRVINVIEVYGGIIDNLESFGVFEEQLSDDVVETAENHFKKMIKEKGVDGLEEDEIEEAIEDAIENGTWESPNGKYEISIIWSEI